MPVFHSKSLTLKFMSHEHRLLRELRRHNLANKTILLAVSGGLDSVFMVLTLYRLRPAIGANLHLAYIHHGKAVAKVQSYRDQAQELVKNLATDLGLPFYTNINLKKRRLKSEAEMREFRYKELSKVARKIAKHANCPLGEVCIATAHHRDDLIETQMMRLVRGTGLEGLKTLNFYSQPKLRPLILLRRNEIQKIAEEKFKLQWIEDPTNASSEPLRNWMRHVWLPMLTERIQGADESLARSFELMLTQQKIQRRPDIASNMKLSRGIDRKTYLALTENQKAFVLVQYIRRLKIKSYTQGHVQELLRRLDNGQGEYKFTLLKHEWKINAKRIAAYKES